MEKNYIPKSNYDTQNFSKDVSFDVAHLKRVGISWQLKDFPKIVIEQITIYNIYKTKKNIKYQVVFYDEVASLFCEYIDNPYYDSSLARFIIKTNSFSESKKLVLNFIYNNPDKFKLTDQFECFSSKYRNEKYELNRNLIQKQWIAFYNPSYVYKIIKKEDYLDKEYYNLIKLKGYGKTRKEAIIDLINSQNSNL